MESRERLYPRRLGPPRRSALESWELGPRPALQQYRDSDKEARRLGDQRLTLHPELQGGMSAPSDEADM